MDYIPGPLVVIAAPKVVIPALPTKSRRAIEQFQSLFTLKLRFHGRVIAPIKELVGRLGPWAVPVLLLIAGFRMPGYLSSAMSVPLFKSLHISDTDIATVTKMFGFWIALGGTFLASYIVRKVGLMTSLLVGTVAGSALHLSLAWLAGTGQGDFLPFVVAVSVEGLAYSLRRSCSSPICRRSRRRSSQPANMH
jgi:hypothetical protein